MSKIRVMLSLGLWFFLACQSYSIENAFSIAKQNSETERASGLAPDWVGTFCAVASCDEVLFAYTSTDSGFAFRNKRVSGFGVGKIVPIGFENGLLVTKIHHDNINCPRIDNPLVVAKLQGCVFLVPSGNVHGFCLNVRERRVIALEKYLHTVDDFPAAVSDLPKMPRPELPSAYSDLCDLPEFKLKVQNVIRSKNDRSVVVEVRVPDSSLLRKGMEFKCMGAVFELEVIQKETAIAVCVHEVGDNILEKLIDSSIVTSR
jgi:hypothetical protein